MARKKTKLFNFRFYVAAALLTAAGILCAVYTELYISILIGAGLTVLLLFLRKKRVFFIGFFVVGMLLTTIHIGVYKAKPDIDISYAYIEGTVDELVVDTGSDKISLSINNLVLDGEKLSGRAYVSVSREAFTEEIRQGDAVAFYGSIKKYFLNPKQSFSVGYYLKKRYYSVSVLTVVSVERDATARTIGARFRQKVYETLREKMSDVSAGTAYALLFGDSSDMTDEASAAYKDAGLSHIFAVSGLHFGFLFALIVFIFDKLKFKKQPYRGLATAAVFLSFAALCGFSASVTRALIMISVILIAEISGRKYDKLNALAFAAFVIFLINPLFLLDVGFELSFSAVLGIVLFVPILNRFFAWLCTRRKLPLLLEKTVKRVGSSFSVTLSANLCIFPFLCKYFGGMPIVTFLSNQVAVPIISLLFPFLLIVSFLSAALPFLTPLLGLANAVLGGLTSAVELLTQSQTFFLSAKFGAVTSVLFYCVLIYLSDLYLGKRLSIMKRMRRKRREE
ncbi:MAG: ComEC/Rec2 family competence protein [Clostridiales bacterium]|nr:ComEC/Rec2 family competence protein [Clostridiales bacterium]